MNQIHVKWPMSRIPSFALLRAFEAAARAESFAQAAEALHLTPSAVSHQIKELEAYLGRALFYRRHRRVELTPAGQRLAQRLTGLFDQIEAACSEAAAPSDAAVLALHSAHSFASKWLGPRLKAFSDANPSIAIALSSGAEPADLIRQRDIDVAVSYGRVVRRDGLRVYALGVEEIAPLCAPALRAEAASPAELLARCPLIYSPLNRVSWDDWFERQGLPVPAGRRLSFDRASLAIAAAVDGMGVYLDTVRLAERELEAGTLVRLDDSRFAPIRCEMHYLSLRSRDRQLPKVGAFVDWLMAASGLQPPPD